MYTQERRDQMSERMKAFWADPANAKRMGDSRRKQPLCTDCGETSIANFYVDPLGRRTNKVCRECHKARCKAKWHSKTPIERQAGRVSALYGITSEQYKQMYEDQQGKCKICDTAPTKRNLHVDHCHSTNKVRGFLCSGCNTALGSFKDSPDLLTKAIEYLRS